MNSYDDMEDRFIDEDEIDYDDIDTDMAYGNQLISQGYYIPRWDQDEV